MMKAKAAARETTKAVRTQVTGIKATETMKTKAEAREATIAMRTKAAAMEATKAMKTKLRPGRPRKR